MMKKQFLIKLKEVTKSDYRFLFNLLVERDRKITISHKKMPSYRKHVDFVKSKPYTKWYIIYNQDSKCGAIYLSKQDEIGIHLLKNCNDDLVREKSLYLLMKKNPRKRYLANLSPKNLKGRNFFKSRDFKLIQYTYELTR